MYINNIQNNFFVLKDTHISQTCFPASELYVNKPECHRLKADHFNHDIDIIFKRGHWNGTKQTQNKNKIDLIQSFTHSLL